jgi:hypothetical protein
LQGGRRRLRDSRVAVQAPLSPGYRGRPAPAASHACGTWNPARVRAARGAVGRSQEGRNPRTGQDAREAKAGGRKAAGNQRRDARVSRPGAVAMTGSSFTTPVWEGGRWAVPAIAEVKAVPRANGPEDQPRQAPAQWDKTDWRAQGRQVQRLRQRIFKAARGAPGAPPPRPPPAHPQPSTSRTWP